MFLQDLFNVINLKLQDVHSAKALKRKSRIMGDPERRARDPQMQVHAYGARGSVFRTRTYNPVAGHIHSIHRSISPLHAL